MGVVAHGDWWGNGEAVAPVRTARARRDVREGLEGKWRSLEELHARRDVASPGPRDLEAGKQLSAIDFEEQCSSDALPVTPIRRRRQPRRRLLLAAQSLSVAARQASVSSPLLKAKATA